mmetsp:Transcript_3226/g.10133  ORF Transcript_3226/g.10133 Transcript_3226/m.10133 type:complete len:226 (+) Transcript_3226:307-984(+)
MLPSSTVRFNSSAAFIPDSLASSASTAFRWSPAMTRARDSRKLLTCTPCTIGARTCCLASASSARTSRALTFASMPKALRQASCRRSWKRSNASARRCRKASISATGGQTGSSVCRACTTTVGFMPLGLASSPRISPSLAAAPAAPSSLLRRPAAASGLARCSPVLPSPVPSPRMERVSSAAAATRNSASAFPSPPSTSLPTSGASNPEMKSNTCFRAFAEQPMS